MKINDGDDVLIVVDVQYDSLPGGSLAVPDGASVIPTLSTEKGKLSDRLIPLLLVTIMA